MMRVLSLLGVALLAISMASPADARWRPAMTDQFDWQFTSPFDLESPSSTINLDAFDASRRLIARLRAQGTAAICYVNVGAWENWRADKRRFPQMVLGKKYVGWEGERWLDVRRLDILLPIMRARFQMCRDKGFLAIEPDNLDGFENDTGFRITRAQQVRYNRAIAQEAHALGLSIGQKNAPGLVAELAEIYDFAITEDCFHWKWCERFKPFLAQGKPVVAIEYPENGRNPLKHCADAARMGIQIVIKRRKLDGWSARCR